MIRWLRFAISNSSYALCFDRLTVDNDLPRDSSIRAGGLVHPFVQTAPFLGVQIAQSVPVFQGEKLSLCLRHREFFDESFPLMRSLSNKALKDEKHFQAQTMVPMILPIKKGHISCSFVESVRTGVGA